MRLWSLHPRYLDRQGLLALWREALLAQKVLSGGTRGYRHHPQLRRFLAQPRPLDAIGAYLRGVRDEAGARGYRFDAARIGSEATAPPIEVSTGQLRHEREHLRAKLRRRDPARLPDLAPDELPLAHPLFRVVEGPVAEWERGAP